VCVIVFLNFFTTPPPNNGMHPTANTLLVKFLQTLGAAGDARVMPLRLM
jgi:hypothetical protein